MVKTMQEPKLVDRDLYAEEFARARGILVLAQATLLRGVVSMRRAEIDKLVATCRAMPLRRPRRFTSLIDACMSLAKNSPGDSLSPMFKEFWTIVDSVREREKARRAEEKKRAKQESTP